MINLKEQLHEGCTVYFRCGGSAVVIWLQKSSDAATLKFKDDPDSYRYYSDGKLIGWNSCSYQFDIVKIDPKPFDWKDVKQKMAFKDMEGNTRYYVAEDFKDNTFVILCSNVDCIGFDTFLKKELTRYKEGDLK